MPHTIATVTVTDDTPASLEDGLRKAARANGVDPHDLDTVPGW